MIFEAIAVGAMDVLGSHRFTAEEIKRYAVAWDSQPFHMDEAAAEKTHFGALCASGWHTASVMMRLMVAYNAASSGGDGSAFSQSPGFDEMKWLKPVYVGDTITFTRTVRDKRLSKSRPGWGIVKSTMEGRNQKGDLVFSLTGNVFMKAAEQAVG